MFRLVMVIFFFHHTQGYGVKLQGNVDVGKDLAVMFRDLIHHYLQSSSTGETEVDLGKILREFQAPPEESRETEEVDSEQQNPVKEIARENSNKSSWHTEEYSDQDPKTKDTDISEENIEKGNHKTKATNSRNKNVKDRKPTQTNEDPNGTGHGKRANSEEEEKQLKSVKEKTFLEDLIGMQESVHVYGTHNRNDPHNVPLNNIKT